MKNLAHGPLNVANDGAVGLVHEFDADLESSIVHVSETSIRCLKNETGCVKKAG